MKTFMDKSLRITVLAAVFVGFLIHLQEAFAERGGYGGGSFRGGGEYFAGPRGGEVAEGPRGNVALRGPEGNVAVGTRVTTLPAYATTTVVFGRTYYVAGGVYYQPYYAGADVVYVVVDVPQQ